MNYKLINEQTIMIYFEERIDPNTFQKVQHVEQCIKSQNNPAIIEIVSSYRAIMLTIDISKSDLSKIITELNLNQMDLTKSDDTAIQTQTINLPVLYGGSYGQDIQEVATHNNLTTEEVIRIHTENAYLIYMLGFMPGFPFLGGLDRQLHTPRRQEPRTSIHAGSVGIANNQTGLYPKQSPGGWQIIGRTPIKVFDIHREPMCLYGAGDYIKFYAIEEATYHRILDEQQRDDFEIEKWVKI
ncbi:5-oxoprolinase subunit PxpB [Staphylococcus equorum]|uniref:5-oxoprolinase subunit PxpB n=1 Tax=Staphylococcus equorum TaxID=246432 RepID=A0A9X4QZZ6_9STAP|nr:5-oxoprolinase subunit PxpB [Staphylococcus equorum]MDG0842602.1 5-oxoprolinase subunit PxpB [Staphylococcus equorum]MDG0858267.1 5-oxoprolinase subunit PxpB [Staphylococcus equorum]